MNILLLEPSYPNKYPPLGLMKLAAYHRGLGHQVTFAKHGHDAAAQPAPLLRTPYDRVYVSSLFTFEWPRTRQALCAAVALAGGHPARVFTGGIAATLIPHVFRSTAELYGIRVITGLLDKSPRQSLGLTRTDFDHAAATDTPIDHLAPDYSVLADSTYRHPVQDAYFAYTTRGCIRSCSFCGVPALEGRQRDNPGLAAVLKAVDRQSGPRKDLLLLDNNVTASPRLAEIIAEIRDLGFHQGATLTRGGHASKRRVDFNQGVDARLLARAPTHLRLLATLCLDPLRIAFDHVGLRRPYETSVRAAHGAGITSISAYLLYNFHDTPDDLYRRMALNIALNQELGILLYGFPMRFQPVHLTDRSHVGPGWSRYLLRSMQVILQATHGVVSGAPTFFTGVFGDSAADFRFLLTLPHAFIMQRRYYAQGPGRELLHDYLEQRVRLTPSEDTELQRLLAPHTYGSLARALPGLAASRRLRRLLAFHARRPEAQTSLQDAPRLPLDQQIEDAFIHDPPGHAA